MSIASEIIRLQELKADLRTKLVGMNLAEASASLEDCVGAVEDMNKDNGAVSTTLSVSHLLTMCQRAIMTETVRSELCWKEKIRNPRRASSQQITPSTGKGACQKVTLPQSPGNLADVSRCYRCGRRCFGNKNHCQCIGRTSGWYYAQ